MKFELHIQSDNAVPGHELARILGNIADRLERDGNTVGCWELIP